MSTYNRLKNVFLRRYFTGQFSAKPCVHVDLIQNVDPASDVCAQCVALGETWPALRMCLICGHVGCCEDAKYQHAHNHYRETGHPLIKPYKERRADWIWCYEDDAFFEQTTLDRYRT